MLVLIGGSRSTRAQSGDLTIADFEGEKVETVQGLSLLPMTDEQIGGTSDVRMTIVHPGAAGSRGALRIAFRVTNDFAAPFAGAWLLLGADGLPADLSAYKGVRFYARSREGSFAAGAAQYAGVPAFYTAAFEAKADWTRVEVSFETFRRAAPTGAPLPNGAALTPKNITSLTFTVAPQLRGQFDLEIDQVELYR